MSRALLSFLGGLGTGALAQNEKILDRARQERLDAQNTQLFDAKMEDVNRAKTDRLALADASKLAVVEQGAGGLLKPAVMDNRDVGLAENAELPQQGLSEQAYRVQGQGYATPGEADAALKTYNTPDAVNSRTVQALRSTGRASEALQMEAAVKSGQMSDVQLGAAKVQAAREAYNTTALDAFRTKGVFQGAAQMMSDTNALGLGGAKVEAVPTVDGKTMQFFRTGPDGARVMVHQASNDKQGEMDVMQRSLKLAPEKLVDWHMDSLKRASDNEHWDKTYARQGSQFNQSLSITQQNADRQLSLVDMQIKTATLAYDKALEDHKVPSAVKQQVEILRDELKTIATATAKAQAEGLWEAEKPGTKAQSTRQMVVNEQLHALLKPYMPKAGATKGPAFGEENDPPAGDKLPKMAPISYTDKVWNDAEPAASKTTGVPLRVLQSIRLQGERSNGDQISAKGARGVYQFTPATRQAFLTKYNVDAYSDDPKQQALAAAYHLKESFDRTGNWNQAMAGFNGGISGENGTNPTAENKSYAERTRVSGMPTAVPR